MKLIIIVTLAVVSALFYPLKSVQAKQVRITFNSNNPFFGKNIDKLIGRDKLNKQTFEFLKDSQTATRVKRMLAEKGLENGYCWGIINTTDITWCSTSTHKATGLCGSQNAKFASLYFYARWLVVYDCGSGDIIMANVFDAY
jgi:hypothetical protein